MEKIKKYIKILSESYDHWLDDKSVKLSASLSFYSILSLVPLLGIIISVAGFFLGNETAVSSIVAQAGDLVGAEGAELINKLASYSFFTDSGIIPTVISSVILAIGSLAVFIELKDSLNIIWGIEVKPGKGIKLFFKSRLKTFPMVLSLGFLLILLLAVSAALNLIMNYLASKIPNSMSLLQWSDILVSLSVFTFLFGMLYKFLPDVKIEMRYIWPGALITSFLFNIGKYLIGIYLGNTYYGNVYGAAGSLVIVLIWIYYSSMIFFFGAEMIYITRKTFSNKELKISKDFIQIAKTTEQVENVISDSNENINN